MTRDHIVLADPNTARARLAELLQDTHREAATILAAQRDHSPMSDDLLRLIDTLARLRFRYPVTDDAHAPL